jgi:hypothetical protein
MAFRRGRLFVRIDPAQSRIDPSVIQLAPCPLSYVGQGHPPVAWRFRASLLDGGGGLLPVPSAVLLRVFPALGGGANGEVSLNMAELGNASPTNYGHIRDAFLGNGTLRLTVTVGGTGEPILVDLRALKSFAFLYSEHARSCNPGVADNFNPSGETMAACSCVWDPGGFALPSAQWTSDVIPTGASSAPVQTGSWVLALKRHYDSLSNGDPTVPYHIDCPLLSTIS